MSYIMHNLSLTITLIYCPLDVCILQYFAPSIFFICLRTTLQSLPSPPSHFNFPHFSAWRMPNSPPENNE
ncbi:hypothetical protein RIF29_19300 [Crotalaria pallida]|uniref:Uncharacterized protein n=1 Tax=Crotalaria pallida TaxID=3830 RepID=A0AAN9I7L8_CROPI